MMKKIIIGLIVLVTVISMTSFFIYKKNLREPASVSQEKINFEIKNGEGVKVITSNLKKKGLLKHPTSFLVFLKFSGLSSDLQAGTYSIAKNMNILEITDVLTKGKISTTKITIPEGWSVEEIGENLEKKNIVKKDDFISASKEKYDYDFLKSKPEGVSLEGYLYPDTYFISSNSSSKDIIEKMLSNFDKKVTPDLRSQAEKRGLSLHQMLTLASIIEKEVTKEEDLTIVSGIFYKRLEMDMPLEADSTINFITKKNIPSVTAEDLKIDSAYNTYKNKGLPPGPITNPALPSIKAALAPKESPYLYYLNRQDTKETIYSQSLEEHLDNQKKYLE